MAKTMYDIIKKQNGERFAKAIRNYDNGIFDIPDLDKIVKSVACLSKCCGILNTAASFG